MLNIGKLRRGGENYYLNSVARGVEDYYLGSGEAPGYWLASGVADLALSGQVGDHDLRSVLRGRHPASGERLAKAPRAERVPGFDLTFLAPKSVALMHELGPKEASNEVVNAHDAAVAAALGYLERQASGARRGKGGKVSIASKGFIGAAFRHRTSRAGDPLLHTHVLVANLIEGEDGKWGALDAKHLYRHAKTAGYLYQAHLRAELTRRLGVEWTPVRKGAADIKGISREVIKGFSKRRGEVQAVLDEHSDATRREREVAALKTRQAKDYSVSPQRLLPEWREKAEGLGLTEEVLERALRRTQHKALEGQQVQEIAARLAAPAGLTAQDSSFSRREVLQGFCSGLQAGASIGDIEAMADRFLASEFVVPLSERADGLTRGESERVLHGRISSSSTEPRYSTTEMLSLEREVIERAIERRLEGSGIADQAALTTSLARRPSLFADQQTMVASLATSGLGVEVVVGKAGSGKTFALDAAREAWELSGYRVIGCSLSARAAQELEAGSGIPSYTIAGLLQDLDHREHRGLRSPSVLVVDEAGMVGTRALDRLLEHAEHSGAKVVLVGDDRQLPEIEAGGAFRAIKNRLPAIELSEVRRQPFGWEREALDLIREGRSEEAIDAYLAHDRVVLATSSEETRRRLIADWWSTQDDTEPAVMIAARRSDVADLNARARAVMRAEGRLGRTEVAFAGCSFATGDRVMALRNSHFGVKNGTRGTVEVVEAARREVIMRCDDGALVTLPRSYLEAGHLTHGYAMTGHKTQAMTTNKAFVLGDETLYREWTYVAMSRGRNDNRLYVVTGLDPDRDEVGGQVAGVEDPLKELVEAVGRSRAKDLAIDAYEQHEIRSLTLTQLREEWQALGEALSEVPPDVADELAAVVSERGRVEGAIQRGAERRKRVQQELDGMGFLRRTIERERLFQLRQVMVSAGKAEARLGAQCDRLVVRESQLQEASDLRDRWVVENAPSIRRRHTLERELWWREQQLALAAEVAMPTYLVKAVGERPMKPSERTVWREAVKAIESYRGRWGVTDPFAALGSERINNEQGRERDELAQRLEEGRRPSPALDREVEVIERTLEL